MSPPRPIKSPPPATGGETPKEAELTPLELAQGNLDAQQALLGDARNRLARAVAVRDASTKALAAAETARQVAMKTSSEARSDTTLVDAAARAHVLLEHARADAHEAIEVHEAVAKEVETGEWAATKAERAFEAQTLLAQLAHPGNAAFRTELARNFVATTLALFDLMQAMRAHIKGNAELVRRVNDIQGEPTVAEPNGANVAGAIAAELLARGGSMVNGWSLNDRLVWSMLPTSQQPDEHGVVGALTLARQVHEFMAAGERPNALEMRGPLERFAAAYQPHHNVRSATSQLEALDAAVVRARDEKNAAEHDKRGAETAKATEIARRRGPGYPKPLRGPFSPGPHNADDPTKDKDHPYWSTKSGLAVAARAARLGVSRESLLYDDDGEFTDPFTKGAE